MSAKNLNQVTTAAYIGTTPSQFSKILAGEVQISVWQISNFAINLQMREIDIFTFPDVYQKDASLNDEPVEAVLQIKLRKDKKEQVLKLVFGENDLEILNK